MYRKLIIEDINSVIIEFYYDMLGELQVRSISYIKPFAYFSYGTQGWCTHVAEKFRPYYLEILNEHLDELK